MKSLLAKIFIFVLPCVWMAGCGVQQNDITYYETQSAENTTQDIGKGNSSKNHSVDMGNKDGHEELRCLYEKMEKQIPQMKYQDMDKNTIDSYTAPLSNEYEFCGRVSEDGYSYLIGLSRSENSILSGMEIYNLSDEIEETESCIKLGKWVNEDKFESKYELKRIENCFLANDGQYIYLEIKQPEQVQIGAAFCSIMNKGESDFLDTINENGMQLLPPTEGAFLQIYRWDNGIWHRLFVPISQSDFAEMATDTSYPEEKWVDRTAISLYESIDLYKKMTPAVDGINQLMSDYVLKNSLVDVQYLENIDDVKQIKVYEYTGSVTVIEDVEIIREIESIIRSSDYMDMGGCPYKNVVELIKNNGDVIRLQFAADGCDGFIIGSSACYSPGGERWERMCDLLGIIK